jgi:hypothetical protein
MLLSSHPDMDKAFASLVRRILAGPVIPFGPRGPKVPTITIGGRKYNLSTDGGPLGDVDDPEETGWAGRNNVIAPPARDKWRFLWAYDTDHKRVAMWRVSDGNEKYENNANGAMQTIIKLEKKGQLNRVTQDEFHMLKRHMGRLQDEVEAFLAESIAQNKSEADREVDKLLGEMFDHARPRLEKQLQDVHEGSTPFGWRSPQVKGHELRSKLAYVIDRFFATTMSRKACEAFLRAKGFDPDAPGIDSQIVEWSLNDIVSATYERYMPERPLERD